MFNCWNMPKVIQCQGCIWETCIVPSSFKPTMNFQTITNIFVQKERHYDDDNMKNTIINHFLLISVNIIRYSFCILLCKSFFFYIKIWIKMLWDDLRFKTRNNNSPPRLRLDAIISYSFFTIFTKGLQHYLIVCVQYHYMNRMMKMLFNLILPHFMRFSFRAIFMCFFYFA